MVMQVSWVFLKRMSPSCLLFLFCFILFAFSLPFSVNIGVCLISCPLLDQYAVFIAECSPPRDFFLGCRGTRSRSYSISRLWHIPRYLQLPVLPELLEKDTLRGTASGRESIPSTPASGTHYERHL